MRVSSLRVSCRTLGGHMSTLVTTTNTGTLSASARPRCSFVMPITPALAPIWMRRTGTLSGTWLGSVSEGRVYRRWEGVQEGAQREGGCTGGCTEGGRVYRRMKGVQECLQEGVQKEGVQKGGCTEGGRVYRREGVQEGVQVYRREGVQEGVKKEGGCTEGGRVYRSVQEEGCTKEGVQEGRCTGVYRRVYRREGVQECTGGRVYRRRESVQKEGGCTDGERCTHDLGYLSSWLHRVTS